MERTYPELLSIGEISKLAEVNPKSIRYYERLGIFRPVWTDPDTGYRYYSPEQIHHLFAIKTCIHVGITLKDFPKYYKDGTLYTSRYLEDASVKFRQSIRQMLDNLAFLENLQNYIGQSDRLMKSGSPLVLEQPERTFLIRAISPNPTVHALFHVFADMNLAARQQQIESSPFYGMIATFHRGQLEQLYAAVQVSRAAEGCDTVTFPKGSYLSLYAKESRILEAPQLFPPHPGEKMMVFESNCVASQYNVRSPGYILRCLSI